MRRRLGADGLTCTNTKSQNIKLRCGLILQPGSQRSPTKTLPLRNTLRTHSARLVEVTLDCHALFCHHSLNLSRWLFGTDVLSGVKFFDKRGEVQLEANAKLAVTFSSRLLKLILVDVLTLGQNTCTDFNLYQRLMFLKIQIWVHAY